MLVYEGGGVVDLVVDADKQIFLCRVLRQIRVRVLLFGGHCIVCEWGDGTGMCVR